MSEMMPIPQAHWDLKMAYGLMNEQVFDKETGDVQLLEPGDIVDWKEGLKNRQPPGPFIVMEARDESMTDDKLGFESLYYLEPLDLCVGYYKDLPTEPGKLVERMFVLMWCDSRRLKKVG